MLKTTKQIGAFLILFFLIFNLNFKIAEGKEEIGKVYIINLSYDNGEISLVNAFAKQGYAPDKKVQPENGYEYRIVSSTNKTLYTFKFFVPWGLTLYDGCGSCGSAGTTVDSKSTESASLNNVKFSLVAPYFKEAKTINVYDPNGKFKLAIDVSKFAEKTELKWLPYLGLFLILLAIGAGIAIYRLFYKKTGAAALPRSN